MFFNKQHFSGPIKSEWKVRVNGKLKSNHMGRHDVILRSIKLTFCEVFIGANTRIKNCYCFFYYDVSSDAYRDSSTADYTSVPQVMKPTWNVSPCEALCSLKMYLFVAKYAKKRFRT